MNLKNRIIVQPLIQCDTLAFFLFQMAFSPWNKCARDPGPRPKLVWGAVVLFTKVYKIGCLFTFQKNGWCIPYSPQSLGWPDSERTFRGYQFSNEKKHIAMFYCLMENLFTKSNFIYIIISHFSLKIINTMHLVYNI